VLDDWLFALPHSNSDLFLDTVNPPLPRFIRRHNSDTATWHVGGVRATPNSASNRFTLSRLDLNPIVFAVLRELGERAVLAAVFAGVDTAARLARLEIVEWVASGLSTVAAGLDMLLNLRVAAERLAVDHDVSRSA